VHHIQTGIGTHSDFYSLCTRGGSFPVDNQLEHEADHSPPSNAGMVKNACSYVLTPTSSWCDTCLSTETTLPYQGRIIYDSMQCVTCGVISFVIMGLYLQSMKHHKECIWKICLLIGIILSTLCFSIFL
jgi:hypothetical protein